MYNFLKTIFSFPSRTNEIMLGRWKLKHECLKKETINMFYSNSDHCGDKICGNVIENKKLLEEKLSKIIQKERDVGL